MEERGAAVVAPERVPPAPERRRTPTLEPATGPSLGARLVAVLLPWAAGAAPVAARLSGHGTDGIRGAVVVGVLALLVAAALHLRVAGPRGAVPLLGVSLVVGVALTAPMVGRAPFAVALAGVALGSVAVDPAAGGDGTVLGGRSRLLALAPLVVAGVLWYRSGSLASFAACWLVAAGVAWAYDRLPLDALDRGAWRTAGAIGRGSREWARAAAGWVRDPFLAAIVRGFRTAGRRVRSAVARTGRWLIGARNRPIVLSGLFVAVVTAPIFRRVMAEPWVLVRGTNDVPGTIDRVHWMQFWPLRMPVPHPGWSLTMKALIPVLGEVAAVTLVLALATGAGTAVLITIARGRWDEARPLAWPFACALGVGYVLMENPAVLAPPGDGLWGRFQAAGEFARGQGYAPIHQWATPTITMSMPFVFALFALVLLVVRDVESGSPRLRRHARALTVLTVVSTLVQPATTLALVPALPVYLVLSRRLTVPMAKLLAVRFVLPGALICVGQVLFLATSVSPWEQATWIWDPFWALSHFGILRASYWATMLFFPLCIWVGGRRYLSLPGVQLAFTAIVVTLGPFLFLEQTTIAEVKDGDLGVPVMMSIILLFVVSLRFVLGEFQDLAERRRSPAFRVPAWAWVTGAFLAVMLCAGVVDLLSASGLIEEV